MCIRDRGISMERNSSTEFFHGIEERGIYRIHQFEKQEMIVVSSRCSSACLTSRSRQNLSLIHI